MTGRATMLLTMVRAREVMLTHASRRAVAHAQAGNDDDVRSWLERERASAQSHQALVEAYELEFGEVPRGRHGEIAIEGVG